MKGAKIALRIPMKMNRFRSLMVVIFSQARIPQSQGFPDLLQDRLSSVSAADKLLSDMSPVVKEVAEKTES